MPPQIPYTGGQFGVGGMVQPQYRDWVNQNFVPANQSPSDAFWSQMTRQYVPGGPWMQDLPQAGFQSFRSNPLLGLLSRAPWAGGAGRSLQARNRAEQATTEGWMVQPPNESTFSRGLAGLSSILQYVPGGAGSGAMGMAKTGLGALRGLMDLPGYASSFQEAFAGAGGEATRSLLPTASAPFNWTSPNEPSYTSPYWDQTNFAGANNFALQGPRDFAQERMGG